MEKTPQANASSSSFKCVLCSKVFDEQTELRTHFRSHSADRPSRYRGKRPAVKLEPGQGIECDVCGEEFAHTTAAIQHKFRKHPNVNEKYHCPVCGKMFPLLSFLERHVLTHDNLATEHPKTDNPCDVCGTNFYNIPALRYHYTTIHQRVMKLFQPIATAPPSKKIKVNNAGDVQSVYFCHICGTEYVVKFNLQKHLENFHTQEERQATPTEMIKCTACDALFYNAKAYENHNLGHRPDDRYVTDEEQRLQLVSRVDQDFDIRRVSPVTEKYVPSFRKARKIIYPDVSGSTIKEDDDSSLSPPSSPDPSSESDSERPANKAD